MKSTYLLILSGIFLNAHEFGAQTPVGNRFDNIREAESFIVDPPTLHCLGFRWYIRGDDNGDALGELSYRKTGDPEWSRALPMLRVNREVTNRDYEPYACENLLAGSIFDLEPDTRYEVHCSLSDPDGGRADTTVVVRTWKEPVAPRPLRTLHLYPGPRAGQSNGYTRIEEVAGNLQAGDLVLVHGGVHDIGAEAIRIETDGTQQHPIVFRGAGDGEAIIQAEYNSTIFDISDRNHLFFEDLTIRSGRVPFDESKKSVFSIYADGASWLTVRNCTIENARTGIQSFSEHSQRWYITDNVITGYNQEWYPRFTTAVLKKEGIRVAHTGINIYGRGHVVAHNRVSKFWDCIAIADHGRPSHEAGLKCVAIDMYNNDLSEAVDDGLETDYGCHNIRVFNNRIMNAHTGLSAQPTYGGPIYFIRNELYNITHLSLKFHNWCTGLEIYHNTVVTANSAFRSSSTWQNGIFRNNLFLGSEGYTISTGSPHPGTTLDYNGYNQPEPGSFARWNDGNRSFTCESLEAFRQATDFEKHGIMVDIGIFEQAGLPEEGTTWEPGSVELSLLPDLAPVDAGTLLHNINDGYTGKGPDLGCYERGMPKPHYGPRK